MNELVFWCGFKKEFIPRGFNWVFVPAVNLIKEPANDSTPDKQPPITTKPKLIFTKG